MGNRRRTQEDVLPGTALSEPLQSVWICISCGPNKGKERCDEKAEDMRWLPSDSLCRKSRGRPRSRFHLEAAVRRFESVEILRWACVRINNGIPIRSANYYDLCVNSKYSMLLIMHTYLITMNYAVDLYSWISFDIDYIYIYISIFIYINYLLDVNYSLKRTYLHRNDRRYYGICHPDTIHKSS